jgi:hypothetical protein
MGGIIVAQKSWNEITHVVMHSPDGREICIELTDESRAMLQSVQEKYPDLSRGEIFEMLLKIGIDFDKSFRLSKTKDGDPGKYRQ